jgi:type IV secretory pathway TrbD component
MSLSTPSVVHPVHRALYRPLTVFGVERRLFFLSLLGAVVVFNLFYSLMAGVALFAVLVAGARWSTAHDPQALQVLLRHGGTRRRYDAAKIDRAGARGALRP